MTSGRHAYPPKPLRLGGASVPMIGHVRMYVCGITPYDVTHLGHAATYLWADVIDRILRWHGYGVTLARNVTDVDDVLFEEARRRGESPTMLATVQRAKFEATMTSIGVRMPDHSPTAAQAVGQVLQLCAALLAKDAAYERNGTVYARTSSAAERAGLDLETALVLSAEYRDDPDDPDKEHPLDVAVWKADNGQDVSWPSPWGDGRPGWHAECAAMILALFGASVDVHCGGADLAYPHHACESVIAESATGVTPFARAWMRAGTVNIDGAKMAKSTGNLILVDDLLRTHSPAAVRLMCLHRRWDEPWTFTMDELDAAAATLENLYTAAAKPGQAGAGLVPAALLDDLNVPDAVTIALDEGGQAARTLIEVLALT